MTIELNIEEKEFFEKTKEIDRKEDWAMILRFPNNNSLAMSISNKGYYNKNIKTILTKFKNKTFKLKSPQKKYTEVVDVSVRRISNMKENEKIIFFTKISEKNLTLFEMQNIINHFIEHISFSELAKIKDKYKSIYVGEVILSQYQDLEIKEAFISSFVNEASIPHIFEIDLMKKRMVSIFKTFNKDDFFKILRNRTFSSANGLYFTKFEKYLFVDSVYSNIELDSTFINNLFNCKFKYFSKSIPLKNYTVSVIDWMLNKKDKDEIILYSTNRINFSKFSEEELLKYKKSNVILYPLSATSISIWGRGDYIKSLLSALDVNDSSQLVDDRSIVDFITNNMLENEVVEMLSYKMNFYNHLDDIIDYRDVFIESNGLMSFKNVMEMKILNEKY